jgi:acyl carrier protein
MHPDRIEFNVPFSDYGVDSIVGSQLIAKLGAETGLKLNTSILYEHTYIDALAAHLNGILQEVEARACPASTPLVTLEELENMFFDGTISDEDVLAEIK